MSAETGPDDRVVRDGTYRTYSGGRLIVSSEVEIKDGKRREMTHYRIETADGTFLGRGQWPANQEGHQRLNRIVEGYKAEGPIDSSPAKRNPKI